MLIDEVGYEAALKASYAGAKQRLWAPEPKQPRKAFPRVAVPEKGAPLVVTECEEISPPGPEMDSYGFEVPRYKIIMREVAAKHSVRIDDLRSPRRDRKSTAARAEAAYRMRKETDLSLPQIGRKLGGRDHSTVFYSIKKHECFLRGETQMEWKGSTVRVRGKA